MAKIIKIRIFLWLILAVIILWFLYMGVVPGGKISYVYDFENDSYFIKKLTPEERVEPVFEGSQRIVGDPVYFSLRTSRGFDKAKLILKYKNPDDLPLIEAGILTDKIIWNYNLKPIRNKIIDQLALVWNVIYGDSGEIFLQRENKYSSIEEFLNNLPEINELALYNYDLKYEYLIEDYQANEADNKINYALRGPYQFYTYLGEENMDFKFNFFDLNKNKDKDEIDLNLYYQGQLIDSWRLDDDETTEEEGKIKERDELNIKLPGLPEGVYKFELRAGDDIVTKNITTKQKKLSFINKIWLADEGKTNINLITDSRIINAQTINPAKLQKIKVASAEIELSQTYKQFTTKVFEDNVLVEAEKDDIILSGNGMFSFTQSSFINPEIKKVDSNMDINYEGINYVLANYSVPRQENGWDIAEAEFNLSKAYREFEKNSFLISVPGLKGDDGIDDGLEIGRIAVELEGKNLWEKIGQKFK